MSETTRKAGLYIVVGAWNTLFGTGAYLLFTWFLEGCGHYGYMLAAVLGNVIGISESFLAYKLIVFRTRGHWLSEYTKCWLVYGVAALINILLLPLCVECIRYILAGEAKACAPYVGGIVMTCLTIAISFFCHKNITFSRREMEAV